MVWAYDEKRGALRRKDGGENESKWVKDRRNTKENMVGPSEGLYQKEGTVVGGSVRPCYTEACVIVHRPDMKVGIR